MAPVFFLHVIVITGIGNLEESASTIVFWAVCIMTRLRLASIMLVVVIPKSRSIPSTPMNNLLHEKSANIFSAYFPTTDRLLCRNIPPSRMIYMFFSLARIFDTSMEAVMTVNSSTGTMLRASACMVVPDAICIESLGAMRLAAFIPISLFSSTYSFSFSLTFLLSI